jgi:hypothetical protein
MTRTTPKITYLFDRIFVSIAICSPILMVIVGGMLPVGSRGPMIVTGHEFLVGILGFALVPRVVHEIGFARCVRAAVRTAASVPDRVRRAVSRNRSAMNSLHLQRPSGGNRE